MELTYKEEGHCYVSSDDPTRKWTSVTTLLHHFKEPFDKEKVAGFCSRKKSSKWYGMPPEKIIAHWEDEALRANTLGTWYHAQREKEVSDCETIQRNGIDLPIFKPIVENNIKVAPEQTLVPGIYPEHFVYLKSANLCGQADRVEVVQDMVNIYDYKTNKKIDTHSYVNREGISKKMLAPLEHLEDCNLIHYALQLSTYMYMILKHNHNLKPGKLIIQHISFKVASEDENGFPIMAVDQDGNPIIHEVTPYEVPYMPTEIAAMINYIKLNPNILTK